MDAAHILRLYLDANKSGKEIVVKFYAQEKTFDDIKKYIQKRKKDESFEYFLNLIANEHQPPHITYQIRSQINESSYPQLACGTETTNPVFFSGTQGQATHEKLQPTSINLMKFRMLQTPDRTPERPSSAASMQSSDSLSNCCHPLTAPSLTTFQFLGDPAAELPDGFDDQDGLSIAFSGTEAMNNSLSQRALTGEFQFSQGGHEHLASASSSLNTDCNVHCLVSVTPLVADQGTLAEMLHRNTDSLNPLEECDGFMEIEDFLDSRNKLGDNSAYYPISGDSDGAHFLRGCISACICQGQGFNSAAGSYLEDASKAFEKLTLKHPDECIPIVANLKALIETYGQREMAHKILKTANETARNTFGPGHPIPETIAFILGTRRCVFSISKLKQVQRDLVQLLGFKSQSSITAHFNVAWALTENEQSADAVALLEGKKDDCIAIFGSHHIQTVSWFALLARSYFSLEYFEAAERIFRENVTGSLVTMFPTGVHPYMLEARHREARFLKKLQEKEKDQFKRSQYLQRIEDILRMVLLGRYKILGPPNPQTARTFRFLRTFLESQGRGNDAQNLLVWVKNQCDVE